MTTKVIGNDVYSDGTNIVGLYSIHDIVAEEFGPVYEAKNEGVAVRAYNQFMQKVMNKNDYVLHRLGFSNKDNGSIVPDQKVVNTEELTYEA